MNWMILNVSRSQIASSENLDAGVKTFIDIMEVFTDFFTSSFIGSLETHVGGAITQIAPLFLAGFGIYAMLLSFNWLREGVDENLLITIKSMIGWLLIIAFAFNADNFIHLAGIIYEFPDKLAAVFSGTSVESSSSIFTSVLTIGTDMDASLYEARKNSSWYEFKGITYTLMGGIIMFSTLVIFMLVLIYYLLAKISLLLTLMVGPIFVGFMLYPSTRQYGMNWLGQVINYTITIVLYVIVTNMVATVSLKAFELIRTYGDNSAWDTGAAVLSAVISILMAILVFFIVFNIPNITSALTGGASISASGGMRFLTGAKGLRFMRNMQQGGSISNNRGRK